MFSKARAAIVSNANMILPLTTMSVVVCGEGFDGGRMGPGEGMVEGEGGSLTERRGGGRGKGDFWGWALKGMFE